ncbi:IS630 family transposase, partial [Arthrobacter sp. AET 35A]|nr:IS630 family transposase [Arthrobacter sp. AET 35A]MBE0011350.1 IS630 family transposase [Arthrobacter sp. AET 35A]MBE0011658.1 IS630 family transposase [Arthrobacter sp. AET 35A]
LRFQSRYNLTAVPFDWRFSRDALRNLLDRVNRHEQAAA